LLTLTYGDIFSQIIKDNDNIYGQTNNWNIIRIIILYRRFSIAQRLIDEFVAKSDSKQCYSLKEISETMAKVNK